jgi:AcrR family transcriptional regulator
VTKAGTLRADAAQNRARLVSAAADVFAERGLDAPLDDIARRAGVGNATLYRRFPTRCDLVEAAFLETMREVAAASTVALTLALEDPWEAFAGHITFLCEVQARNRALADLLVARVGGDRELEQLRARALRGLVELIARAQDDGSLRPEFRHQDVVLVLMANSGLLDRTAGAAPTAWRRHLGFVLDGLRAGDARALAPPPSQRSLLDAMQALAERVGLREAYGARDQHR